MPTLLLAFWLVFPGLTCSCWVPLPQLCHLPGVHFLLLAVFTAYLLARYRGGGQPGGSPDALCDLAPPCFSACFPHFLPSNCRTVQESEDAL